MLKGKIKTIENEGYAWIIAFKPKRKDLDTYLQRGSFRKV